MNKLLLLLLFLPAVAAAQFNRSATELAKENIREYVTHKLFKDGSYQSISFGELKVHKADDADIAWSIPHKFSITEKPGHQGGGKGEVTRMYDFLFYCDKKMNVQRAERFF